MTLLGRWCMLGLLSLESCWGRPKMRNCRSYNSTVSMLSLVAAIGLFSGTVLNVLKLICEQKHRNWLFDLRPCQHDNGYMDGRSQIKVHTYERTQVHSAQSSLVVTHPSTNRARRYLTSATESPSKHWSPTRVTGSTGNHLIIVLHQ